MRSANPLPRIGAVFNTDLATFIAGPIAVVLAVIISVASYAYLSDFGSAYDFARHVTAREIKEPFKQFGDFEFYLEPTGPESGNKVTLYHENAPIVTVSLVGNANGIDLAWNYQWSFFQRIDSGEGKARRKGKQTIIYSTRSALGMPYVQNTTLEIPSGTMLPLLQWIVRYGETISDSQFDEVEEQAALAIMNNYLLDSGLSSAYDQAIGAAFWSGDIQFLTLLAFVLFLLFTAVTLVSDRLAPAAGFLMESMPYLGFYGTLLGMGQALQILGFANLSDGLQKAINLGPIGSQMGLAIETTKFALVLYLAAGIISHLIDVVAEGMRRKAGVKETPLGVVD